MPLQSLPISLSLPNKQTRAGPKLLNYTGNPPSCLETWNVLLAMIKTLCISSMVIGLLMVVIFGVDLAIALPFGRPSVGLGVCFIIGGLILAYMGWSLQREMG